MFVCERKTGIADDNTCLKIHDDLPDIIQTVQKDQLDRRVIDRSIRQDFIYLRLMYGDRKPE